LKHKTFRKLGRWLLRYRNPNIQMLQERRRAVKTLRNCFEQRRVSESGKGRRFIMSEGMATKGSAASSEVMR